MTRKILSTHRLKSGTFNTFEFNLAKQGEFHVFCPFQSVPTTSEDLYGADLIVCALRGAKEFLSDNKGTPVIVVDPYPDPSISRDLVSVVKRPEVKACLRKWGFRDPASYYRVSPYYDSVSDLASFGASPDPFPVFTDEPTGNVVRKIRTLLPPCPLMDATFDVPSWEDREFEVCAPTIDDLAYWAEVYLDKVGALQGRFKVAPSPYTTYHADDIKRVYPNTRGTMTSEFKVDETFFWGFFNEVRDLCRRSKVVISNPHFLYLDFLALVNGCVLVKPECSNVLGYCDIYSSRNPSVLHCSHMYDNLVEYVEEALRRPPLPEDVKACQETLVWNNWTADFQNLCEDILCGRERLGDIRKVTPLV